MEFVDSETQLMLRATARSLLGKEYPWPRLYRIEAGEEQLTRQDAKAFADLGWFGLLLPEAADGGGATLLDAAAIVEEFGYAAVCGPLTAATVSAALLADAPSQPGDSTLAAIAAGHRVCTVSDATRRRDAHRLVVNGDAIDGELPLVAAAGIATDVITPALIDGEEAFVIAALDGAKLEPLRLLDRRDYANVHFDGVRGAIEVLARGDDAIALHERCDALTTVFSLIELSGIIQRILELTTAHITTRQQFGQPIGKFQSARHRAADILMQVETTRWAAYHALWRFQHDRNAVDEIWLTKHWAVRAVDRIFQHTHMLHGGVGVGMEHPLHLFTQAMMAQAVRGGTIGEMVERTVGSERER